MKEKRFRYCWNYLINTFILQPVVSDSYVLQFRESLADKFYVMKTILQYLNQFQVSVRLTWYVQTEAEVGFIELISICMNLTLNTAALGPIWQTPGDESDDLWTEILSDWVLPGADDIEIRAEVIHIDTTGLPFLSLPGTSSAPAWKIVSENGDEWLEWSITCRARHWVGLSYIPAASLS